MDLPPGGNHVSRRGVGLAVSAPHDLRGPIGRASQSLLVGERKL